MAIIVKIDNVDITSIVRRPSLIVTEGADNRSKAEFALNETALSLGTDDGILVGLDVQILDGATLIFGGIVQEMSIIKLERVMGNEAKLAVNVEAIDYNDIPSRRVTTSLFTDKTAGEIVTSLVNDVLNLTGFDDNVGLGTIDNGATFDSYSAVAKSVKEILDDLAITSGFKWYIDDAKDMYFVQEDTIVSAAHELLEITPTFTDFEIIDLNISLENYRNKQWVIGDKNDVGEIVVTDAADNTEIAARAAIEGTSGVYGNIIKTSDAQTTTDADDAALNGLKQFGIIPYIIEFRSDTNDWAVGTKLKVNLPSYGLATDTYFLIELIELEDQGTTFRSFITASRRKESDFSTQRTENYVDYFAKMVNNPLNVGTGGSGGSGQNTFDSYLFMFNDASFDITTVLGNENRDLELTFKAHTFVDINLTGVADTNTELRAYLYLGVWNGASYDYTLQKTFKFDAPQDLDRSFHVRHTLMDMQPDNYNVKIEFDTSVGTFTCTNAKDLYFWVSSQGLAPVNSDEPITFVDRLYYSENFSQTIGETDPDTMAILNSVSINNVFGIGGTSNNELFAGATTTDRVLTIDPDSLTTLSTTAFSGGSLSGTGGTSDRLYSTVSTSQKSIYELNTTSLAIINTLAVAWFGFDGAGGTLDQGFYVSSSQGLIEFDLDTLAELQKLVLSAGSKAGCGGISDRAWYGRLFDKIYEFDLVTLATITSTVPGFSNQQSGLGGLK